MVLNQLTRLGSLGRLQPDEPAVRPPHTGQVSGRHLFHPGSSRRTVSVLKEVAHLASLGRIPPDMPTVRPPHTCQAPRFATVHDLRISSLRALWPPRARASSRSNLL